MTPPNPPYNCLCNLKPSSMAPQLPASYLPISYQQNLTVSDAVTLTNTAATCRISSEEEIIHIRPEKWDQNSPVCLLMAWQKTPTKSHLMYYTASTFTLVSGHKRKALGFPVGVFKLCLSITACVLCKQTALQPHLLPPPFQLCN